MTDLVQSGATVGTVVCPVGPRSRAFIGQRDSHEPEHTVSQLVRTFPDRLQLEAPQDSAWGVAHQVTASDRHLTRMVRGRWRSWTMM
ncbi:hypothetical protein NOR_01661 [Metarhizium rileyi]|uniref:Uncharacterized protein n=1 Tax=Metarhizium rileyi (strain RCEF 4871) TaxID=1649241 RepID=A0A167HWN3_METRR|nr:hypothetical protein NOR_01661 [Metarhizium rileyi RCEF 4871]